MLDGVGQVLDRTSGDVECSIRFREGPIDSVDARRIVTVVPVVRVGRLMELSEAEGGDEGRPLPLVIGREITGRGVVWEGIFAMVNKVPIPGSIVVVVWSYAIVDTFELGKTVSLCVGYVYVYQQRGRRRAGSAISIRAGFERDRRNIAPKLVGEVGDLFDGVLLSGIF